MQTNTVLHMLMALCALNEGETEVDANHCQHVADFYQYRDVIKWDNYMRDALGVRRLSLHDLVSRYDQSLNLG